MRALTLTQPWAGLVVSGIKLDENRNRPLIRREDFAVPFALHASREISKAACERILEIAPGLMHPEQQWFRLGAIASAVIGVATIGDVHDLRTIQGRMWLDSLPPERARFVFGPIVYSLRDILALASPVPCRGWQGFWYLTPKEMRERGEVSAVELAVRAQI